MEHKWEHDKEEEESKRWSNFNELSTLAGKEMTGDSRKLWSDYNNNPKRMKIKNLLANFSRRIIVWKYIFRRIFTLLYSIQIEG